MTDLTAQLKALAERPPTAIPAKADLPLELTGQVYVGDPSRPVANQEVRILNVKDGSVVRRVMSDSAGRYRSGPLNAGDYSIAGEIQKPRSGRAEYLQSPPAYVYPGTQLAPCNLDLAYRAGRLKLELSRPLPKLEVEDKYTIDSRLMIRVYSTEFAYSSPWTTQQKMPARWPAFLISIAPPTPPAGRPTTVSYFELLSNQDLTTDWDSTLFASDHGLLPAGTADVAAAVLLDVIPSGFRAQPIAELISNTTPLSNEGQQGRSKGGIKGIFNSALSIHWEKTMIDAANAEGEGPLSLTEGRELTFENDDFFWISKGLGRLWFAHLSKNEGSRRPFRIHAGWVPWRNPDSIPIKEGHVTRLLIDIPADLETRLRDFAMAATTPEEFSKRIPQYDPAKGGLPEEVARGENPFVGPVKLTVVSTEATADSSALPAGRN